MALWLDKLHPTMFLARAGDRSFTVSAKATNAPPGVKLVRRWRVRETTDPNNVVALNHPPCTTADAALKWLDEYVEMGPPIRPAKSSRRFVLADESWMT